MPLARKLDHYAKALITATGLLVLLVANYADVIPDAAMPYVNGVITGLTIFGTWYKANGPKFPEAEGSASAAGRSI